MQEPLIHFLLIGAVLFLVYHFNSEKMNDHMNRIVVTPGQVEQMEAKFTRTWMRPPTKEEMDGLIDSQVRDEIYYREAVAMGLDQNDQSIRQRMRMKLEFLLEDLSVVGDVSDKELTKFLQGHSEKFRLEPCVSFRQVYLDPQKHPDMMTDARNLLHKLNGGAAPEEVGDTTLLGYEYLRASRSDVSRSFGEAFAQDVIALEPVSWTGPLYSQFGGHLVMVMERQESRIPELAEIRGQVEREYLALRRQQIKEDTYRKLRAGYEVVIETPFKTEGDRGVAVAATREEAGEK